MNILQISKRSGNIVEKAFYFLWEIYMVFEWMRKIKVTSRYIPGSTKCT